MRKLLITLSLVCSTSLWAQVQIGTGVKIGGTGSSTVNSVTNSDGSLTISPTTGSVVSSLNIANPNTWTGLQTFGTDISIGGVTAAGATGTSNVVFSNSPTLVTPALGTPSALVGTNITGTASALSIGGNAATATALATLPSQCSSSQVAQGIAANGNANCVSSITGFALVSPTLTGTPDASGATEFKFPVAASFATIANGEIGYDTTNKNWHGWVNAADALFVPLASGFVSGDCGSPTSSGGSWVLSDSGAPCGSGGSSVTLQTNTVANTLQTLLNFTTSTANTVGLTVTPSNPSGGVEKEEVTGLLTTHGGGTGVNNSATLTLGSSNQNWATLGTGIVKNTTTTGALSNAASSDVISLWTGTCNSTTFLNGAGACATPAVSGTVTSIATTSPITGGTITTTGTIACATCVTSAASLTANELVIGSGSQGVQTTALTGYVYGNGTSAPTASTTIPINVLANQAANTILGNSTSSTAAITALSVPSCSGFSNALGWLSGTGLQCNSAINASQLSGKSITGSGSSVTTGPSTSTNNDIVTFTGTSGQIQDSGIQIGTTGNDVLRLSGGLVPLGNIPTIATVQLIMPTTLIGANSCTSPASVTMTGLVAPSGTTPGSTFTVAYESNPDAVTGWGSSGGLSLKTWVSATNTMQWDVCNATGSSVTGGALNVDVGAKF